MENRMERSEDGTAYKKTGIKFRPTEWMHFLIQFEQQSPFLRNQGIGTKLSESSRFSKLYKECKLCISLCILQKKDVV